MQQQSVKKFEVMCYALYNAFGFSPQERFSQVEKALESLTEILAEQKAKERNRYVAFDVDKD